MKKIVKILFMIIITIPIIANAAVNYEEAVNYANNYIFGFDEYLDYIYLKENMNFDFENGIAKPHVDFKSGGLISKEEFNISNFKGNTFLSNGLQYWTLSKPASDTHYMIDYKLTSQLDTQTSGVRVTQFVNPNMKVTGKGSYYEPWTFGQALSVDIASDNTSMGKVSDTSCTEGKETIHLTGGNLDFYVCPEDGYKYLNNTCSKYISYNTSTGKYTVGILERDSISCKVIFSYKTKAITVNGCTACSQAKSNRTIYVNTTHKRIFSDADGVNKLDKLDVVPKRTGYTFKGYFTSANYLDSERVTDDKGKLTYNNNLSSVTKIYPYVKANEYTITFDANGGSGLSKNSMTVTYDQQYNYHGSLPTVSRSGYEFLGWYTKASGGEKITNATTVKILDDTKYYAHWKGCEAGYYSQNGTKCVKCSSGYTSEEKAPNENNCYRILYRTRSCSLAYRCEDAGCETRNSCKSEKYCGSDKDNVFVSKGGESCSIHNGTVRKGYELKNCYPASTSDGPYDALNDCKCSGKKIKSCPNVTCSCKEYYRSYEKCGCEKWNDWGNYVTAYCPDSEFCESKKFYYPN